MSQGTQIDYDALAKQYGATAAPAQAVDYDALAKQHGAIEAPAGDTMKAAPAPFTMPWLKSKAYTIADAATEGLPAAGATAGALIGGGVGTGTAPGPGTAAGAVGGAGIGGMAGEAARQLIRRALGFEAPATSQEAAGEIAKQGAIQGGVQTGAELLPMAAPALEKAAIGQYTRALSPTQAANKVTAQKIVPEMIDRGITGTLPSIENQAERGISAVKPDLDAAYAAMPASATKGSGTQVLADLDKLKGRFMVGGKVARPEAINAIEGVQDIIRQYGADIDPQSLRQLKEIFDDPVASRGGFAGADLTTKYQLRAERAAGNSIRNILHQASPDVANLDKEISFWLDVRKVVQSSSLRKTGQAGGLFKVLSPLGEVASGAIVGAAHGPTMGLETAGALMLGDMAIRAVRSPLWRTTSAVVKDGLADALARGDVGRVASLVTRAGLAAQTYAQQPAQPNPEQQPTPQP